MKRNELMTGMKVKTADGKFYYVIQNFVRMLQNGKGKLYCALMPVDKSDPVYCYGFFEYDENLKFCGMENSEWNITNVYVYAGDVTGMVDLESDQSVWREITEPIELDQASLEKYLSLF